MSRETAKENDTALELLRLEPTDRVLDVGFGHGRTIERAARIAHRGFVAGVDLSEEMRKMAESRCASLVRDGRVELRTADSAALPYPDDYFDKAYSIHTIYFWADPMDHLREIRRVLRPGGRFVLGFRVKSDAVVSTFPPSVYRFYTASEVTELLARVFAEIEMASPAGDDLVLMTVR